MQMCSGGATEVQRRSWAEMPRSCEVPRCRAAGRRAGMGPLERRVRLWGWGADLQLALQQSDLVPQLDRSLPQLLA